MSWNALPPDVVVHIWTLRRAAMARELCEIEGRQRAFDRRVWPLGVSPYSRAKTLDRHACILAYCDRPACGSHEWIQTWRRSASLWCQVCNRKGCRIRVPHPGTFCSEDCYVFV